MLPIDVDTDDHDDDLIDEGTEAARMKMVRELYWFDRVRTIF